MSIWRRFLDTLWFWRRWQIKDSIDEKEFQQHNNHKAKKAKNNIVFYGIAFGHPTSRATHREKMTKYKPLDHQGLSKKSTQLKGHLLFFIYKSHKAINIYEKY